MLAPAVLLLPLLSLFASAQEAKPPSERECKDLIAEYVETNDAERRSAILARLDELEPLKSSKAKTWRKRVREAAGRGEKLADDGGKHELADGRPYYIGGKSKRPKGILIHLHGGVAPSPEKPPSPGSPYFVAAQKLDWVCVMPRRIDGENWSDPKSTQLVVDVRDAALRTWKVEPDRVFLSGTSAGAFGGWRIAARHADRFAGFAAFSGGITTWPREADILADGITPNLRNLPTVVFHAVDDGITSVDSSREAARRLGMAAERWGGFAHRYDEILGAKHGSPPGGPGEQYAWLDENGAWSLPERVVWQPDRGGARQHDWLYWPDPGSEPILVADLDADANTIRIEAPDGASLDGLRVLVNDAMLELDKREVIVLVNDEEVFRGQPERRLATILRTGARGDADRVFDAEIPVASNRE